MAKKAQIVEIPSARLRDVITDIPRNAERFRELIRLSRSGQFTVLATDEFENVTSMTSSVESFLQESLRDVFLAEAEKIARVMKRRFNVTLDPGDVDGD